MQRKLSRWAEDDKQHKFFDLYHLLYDEQWLRLAHDYVKQNSGSRTAGCDGINMKRFDENLEQHLKEIAEQLKSESFQPHPVKRVHVPKANSPGKLRPLGIPAIKDRIVQKALHMILEPIFEADFSPYSFGFRPNRCTMDAIRATMFLINARTKFYWVIEGDIHSYFDTIKHRKLMKLLRRRIKDEKILRLIWRFLRAGVMEGKLFTDTKQGTPQGGIISPLLANIYLHTLDRYMQNYTGLSTKEKTKRRRQGLANFFYVRYADDFVVLSNGRKEQVKNLKEELKRFLADELDLTLSDEKTRITHAREGFKFLGFRIQRAMCAKGMGTRLLIPKPAKDRLLAKVKAVTDKSSYRESVRTKIAALNRITGGWCRYYQYASNAPTTFHKVSHQTYWRMTHWLARKFEISIPKTLRRFKAAGGSLAYQESRLVRADTYKQKPFKGQYLKANPYTMQKRIEREELGQDARWYGYEARPGQSDLKLAALERDAYTCQMCGKGVGREESEVDHIKAVKRYKRPVEANQLSNLWTLCVACHKWKTTEYDQRVESRVR